VEVHLDEGHAHHEPGDEAEVPRPTSRDQQSDEHEHQEQDMAQRGAELRRERHPAALDRIAERWRPKEKK
jgi:hypothetical protein